MPLQNMSHNHVNCCIVCPVTGSSCNAKKEGGHNRDDLRTTKMGPTLHQKVGWVAARVLARLGVSVAKPGLYCHKSGTTAGSLRRLMR